MMTFTVSSTFLKGCQQFDVVFGGGKRTGYDQVESLSQSGWQEVIQCSCDNFYFLPGSRIGNERVQARVVNCEHTERLMG